jgi:hypothetical protein
METRRFDELTVALARGGSRRGVLRGLAGGVLGALAIDQSGALAKNEKPKNDGITIFAKPRCGDPNADCPLCATARANPTCCDQTLLAQGHEQACGTQAVDRDGNNLGLNCTAANQSCTSCVTATCDPVSSRCQYSQVDKGCPGKGVCCNDYTSGKFGTCVANRRSC